jgi:hypothetical protein
MHKKHGKDGLVVISVHVRSNADGETGEKQFQEQAIEALKKLGVEFTSVLLAEPDKFWLDKLDVGWVPCTYVFNRDNRWEAKYTDAEPETQQKLDELVEKLLKK